MADNFDYAKWRFFFEVFLFIWNVAIGVWLWLNRSYQRLSDRIDHMEETSTNRINSLEESINERIDAYEDRCTVKNERVTKIEGQLKGLPRHDDLARLYERVNSLGGDVREMKGTLNGTAKMVERLHLYLLEHDRK